MAVPVIATPPAVTAICAGADDGVIVRERSAMARTLLHMLRTPSYAASLGRNGRRYVEMHHSWQRAAAHLEQVYRAAQSGQPIAAEWTGIAAD